ncbi:hypothetical protein WICMUC_003275 [Wickerhamomyces mucosus]|uniref:PIN domain-containing protein n=1 Tax=Wickerhamomyces mucosus TaxID=1378264 RepID=A0A9P8PLN1_9ASCO|nr:hypothetical protein WICMUC_003275 [Wickerhamomyces mucosus]
MSGSKEILGHYILDVSAFTKGLGTIKRWIESPERDVVLFIPRYTIHELDFLKKGVDMIARNARESIRFIEKTISDESISLNDHPLKLETPDDIGPNWKKCKNYKVKSPKASELGFVSILLPDKRPDIVMYEQDLLDDQNNFCGNEKEINHISNKDPKVELPNRYKYLLRPVIKKSHLDSEDWKLISDDPITRIWCESFGVKCITLGEAEGLIFTARNRSLSLNHGLERLSIQKNANEVHDPKSDDGQHTGLKKKSRNKGRRGKKLDAPVVNTEINGAVRLEKYNSITYAPRGEGKLWSP